MDRFLKEFIQLEKICNEKFDEEHGVSRYITEMENTPSHLQLGVDGWKADYRMLKHIRWARNKLAHEGAEEYTTEDIQWTKGFYQRIMKGEDPLAAAERYKTELASRKQKSKSQSTTGNTRKKSSTATSPKHKKKIRKSVLVVLALLVGLAVGSYCGLDVVGTIGHIFSGVVSGVKTLIP